MSYLNGRLNIIQGIERLLPFGIGISIISLAEIYEGMYGSSNFEQQEALLSDFLASIGIVDVDE